MITLFKSTVISLVILFFATNGYSKSGCCSHHGGVCEDKCCDGTSLSEKCKDGEVIRNAHVHIPNEYDIKYYKHINAQIRKSQESKQKLLDFYNKQSYKKKKKKSITHRHGSAIELKYNDHINLDNLKSFNKCYCGKSVIITNLNTCQPCSFYLKYQK